MKSHVNLCCLVYIFTGKAVADSVNCVLSFRCESDCGWRRGAGLSNGSLKIALRCPVMRLSRNLMWIDSTLSRKSFIPAENAIRSFPPVLYCCTLSGNAPKSMVCIARVLSVVLRTSVSCASGKPRGQRGPSFWGSLSGWTAKVEALAYLACFGNKKQIPCGNDRQKSKGGC